MRLELEVAKANVRVFESDVIPRKGDKIRLRYEKPGNTFESIGYEVTNVVFVGDNTDGSNIVRLERRAPTSVVLEVRVSP